MTITTRLEVKYIKDLIQILLVESTFLLIWEDFAVLLLGDSNFSKEIKDFPIRRKINVTLQRFCLKFKDQATYERIVQTLKQCGCSPSLQEKVKLEVKAKRPKILINRNLTRIEETNMVDIRNILLTDCQFAANLDTFAQVMGMEEASSPTNPNKYLNSIMYNFCRQFPQKAVFENLIEILENMGFPELAESIKIKFRISGRNTPNAQMAQSNTIKKELVEDDVVTPKANDNLITTATANSLHTFEQQQKAISKSAGRHWEKNEIKEGDRGKSYETVLGKYFDENVEQVVLEDPWLKEDHQVWNLFILIKMLAKNCKLDNDKNISFKIVTSDTSAAILENYVSRPCTLEGIKIFIKSKKSIHDRWLRIYRPNTPVVDINLGRGLDWFKSNNIMGHKHLNQEAWVCKKTTVSVFYSEATTEQNAPSSSSGISTKNSVTPPLKSKNKPKRVRSPSQKK